MGLSRIEMDRGLAGGDGNSTPFVAAGHLYFESVEIFQNAFAAHGEEVLSDIANFTNAQPMFQISEIVRS